MRSASRRKAFPPPSSSSTAARRPARCPSGADGAAAHRGSVACAREWRPLADAVQLQPAAPDLPRADRVGGAGTLAGLLAQLAFELAVAVEHHLGFAVLDG